MGTVFEQMGKNMNGLIANEENESNASKAIADLYSKGEDMKVIQSMNVLILSWFSFSNRDT